MKHKTLAVLCAVVLTAGMMTGCGQKTEDTKTESGSEKTVSDEMAEKAGFSDGTGEEASDKEEASDAKDTKEAVLDTSKELTGIHHAQINVKDYGEIQVDLDVDTAPVTVTNFVKLAQEGFYDGLTFHRIIDGFMIQGGDPKGNGTGGSDETIKGEFSENGVENPLSHTRGAISMARSQDYDSASSQFFIVQEDSTYLDGQYAAFGYVTEGMDVVDKICEDVSVEDQNGTVLPENQPVIESIKVVK